MKTTDFTKPANSHKLNEDLYKKFGVKVNFNKYTREQLEDARNKVRTEIHQLESTATFNDLLANESYQKNKHLVGLLNTRIKEMLGESIAVMERKLSAGKKGSKPDFLDIDSDGNKKEPFKKAVTDKKVSEKFDPLKHVKNPTAGEKTAAKDVKRGSYADRAAMLKSAEADGRLKDQKVKEGFPTVASAKADTAKSGTTGMKTGEKRKTSSGGTVTKTAGGTVHKAGSKGYGNKWDGETQDQAPAKSKAAKSAAEKKAAKANDIKLPAWKGTVTKHSSNHGADKDDGTGDVKEATDTVKKDPKTGKVVSWKHEGDWKKDDAKKDPRGKVTHASDVAQRKTAKMSTEGFKDPDQAKLDKNKNGKLDKKDFEMLRKGKKTVKESQHRKNIKLVNESLRRLINEDEEGKAKAITAGTDMVNDFTSWMTRVGQYQTKSMIELADSIRANFGQAEAEQFKQNVAPALETALNTLTQAREQLSNAVATLAGEGPAPVDTMGSDMSMSEPGMDTMNAGNEELPTDEFGASDAASGGGELAGRMPRESREIFARKLSEAHMIISKLSK
jgi:hypothetical protein